MLAKIDQLSQLNPAQIPSDSLYLLEIDFTSLHKDTLEQQSYWLVVMKAAVKADKRTQNRARQLTVCHQRVTQG